MKLNTAVFLGLILCVTACRNKQTTSYIDTLPSFDLLMLDSTTKFNTSNIAGGKPTILIYFSPDCEHCQKETEGILKNMDSLKKAQFYFISNDPLDRMQFYNEAYKLYKYPNITLGRDYAFFFPAHFKEVAPPYMVIYDQEKKYRFTFAGETSVKRIISVINTL